MQKRVLRILACPDDRHNPLGLVELSSRGDDVVDGVLVCPECGRYYPILGEVPVMLPDEMRNKKDDLAFLEKWKSKLPDSVVHGGKPWSLQGDSRQ